MTLTSSFNTIIQNSFEWRYIAFGFGCRHVDAQIPPGESGTDGTIRMATRSRQRQERNLSNNHIE
jgi:hypothetical protein